MDIIPDEELMIDDDDLLLSMLEVDEDTFTDEEIEIIDENKTSKQDFNNEVKEQIYDCKPEDTLSILLELKFKFEIDEDDFSNLLDDMNKERISNKLKKVNLVGDPEINRLENPLDIL